MVYHIVLCIHRSVLSHELVPSNDHIIVIATFIRSISPIDSTQLLRGIQRIIEGNPQMSINIVTSLFFIGTKLSTHLQYHNLNTAGFETSLMEKGLQRRTRQGSRNEEALGTRVTDFVYSNLRGLFKGITRYWRIPLG